MRRRGRIALEVCFDSLDPDEAYFTLIQTVIPRPIAWVLSENEQGRYNLAPFSFFIPVACDPPLILLSLGKKPDGSAKDTQVNIEARRHFVIHIAGKGQVNPLNESSRSLPPEVSEVDLLGLKTVPFGDFTLPRLSGCPVALACRLFGTKEIGNEPQTLIFGEVMSIYIDDDACRRDEKGRLKVSAEKLDPLGRLGADQYAGLGDIISLKRPL